MAKELKKVDVVAVGVGFAGGIALAECAKAGLSVVGLERGDRRGVEDFQDNYNMEVQVIDGHSDATTQVTAIENLITQGVDCIVICPVDTVAPETAVAEAQAAGIPVISWSEHIEGSNAWVAVNNYDYGFENGKIAGQWILDNLDSQEDAKVMYVYVQESEQLIERGNGMELHLWRRMQRR